MEKAEKEEIIKNSWWNVIVAFIQRAGGLVFTIILARFMVPEVSGIYSLAVSVGLIFLSFHTGLNETFLRYLSKAFGDRSKKESSEYFQYIFKVKLLISALTSLVLISLAYPLSFYIFKKPALFIPLIFSGFYIFSFSIEGFLTQFFFAAKKVKNAAVKEITSQTLRVGFTIILFLFAASAYYISGAILAAFFSSLFVSIGIIVYCRKEYSYLFKNKTKMSKENHKRILRFFWYITISYIAFTFFSYIDLFLIGILIPDPSFLGYYRFAYILISSIAGLLVFANVLLPVITQTKKYNLEDAFNKTLRYVLTISIPCSFGLAVLGRYFVRAIYGYAYLPASQPLYILSFVMSLTVISSLFMLLFSAREKPQVHLRLLALIILVDLVLNYVFISLFLRFSPIIATMGAALATFISWTLYTIGLYRVARKRIGVKADFSCIIKPLISSVVMSLVLLVYMQSIKNMTLLTGILGIFLGAAVYLLAMFTIRGTTKSDYLLIKSVLSRRRAS